MSRSSPLVTEHALNINGLTLHYRDWGDQRLPPLLVLHGLGAHARSWDHVAAALADHYRIIVPDLRGHGRSSWAADYSWQLVLDDTLTLLIALGMHQVAVCGHSLGGRVAYMLASGHPERVTRLVIAEAYPLDPPTDDRSGPPPAPDIEYYATIDDALAEVSRRQPYADRATLRHEVKHGLMASANGRWTWRMDPALQTAWWRGQLSPGPALEWPALARIRCPSVMMYGVHSIPRERAATVARTIPGCQLVAIAAAAHDLPNEDPAGFIHALQAFLTETPDSTEPSAAHTGAGFDPES
jgi:pimeloyl-ACP methyl ester carboxylesterase